MNATQSRLNTRALILCALFAALTAVCSQIQIPLPMIPINLGLFAVHLTGLLLGPRYGALSMGVYALLGAIGAPVFTGLMGGPSVLFGKTGGYILGYILAAAIGGFLSRRWGGKFWSMCAAMGVGTFVCYLFGTIWFMILTKTGLWMSLVYCVFPFLVGDVVKIAAAASICKALRKRINGVLVV